LNGTGLPVAIFAYETSEEANRAAEMMRDLIRYAIAIMKPADDAKGWIQPPIVKA
jgi:hypothetical protein